MIPSSKSHHVAAVNDVLTRKLNTKDSSLKIVSLNNSPCSLNALLDTGSSVSFISRSVYKNYFNDSNIVLNKSLISYQSVSGNLIPIFGSINTQICLESFPNFIGNISLLVFQNESHFVDLIIGRDFISDNDIAIYYHPSSKKTNDKLKLFNEVASAELLEDFMSYENPALTDIKRFWY